MLCCAGQLDEARRYSERFLQLAGASGDPTGGGPLREQAGRLLVQVYVRLAELPARRPGALELLHRAHDTAAHCKTHTVVHTHTATHCKTHTVVYTHTVGRTLWYTHTAAHCKTHTVVYTHRRTL